MIVVLLIGTIILAFFIICFIAADDKSKQMIIDCHIMDLEDDAAEQEQKMRILLDQMQRHDEMEDKEKIREGKKLKKKYDSDMKALEDLKDGKINAFDIIPAAGYGLFEKMQLDAKNRLILNLIKQCSKFRERTIAIKYAYYVAASMVGYFALGVACACAALALVYSLELKTNPLIIAVAILGIFGLLGYIPYDNVSNTVKKRQEDIERNFPQVISKLTLLTEAGLELNRAWLLTSDSGDGILYMEMNRVNIDLRNNVSPEEAYTKFIERCANSYTSKLASLIIQNMFKGNSEIVNQLSRLNTECWEEFRNNTQRMGEKVQSKLFVPTLIMFAAIIILIIVPVLSAFGSM